MKYLICNLKSNKDLNEIVLYEHNLRKLPKTKTNLVICPSNPYLICFKNNNYFLGSQDISMYSGGAFTGEVNGKQLSSLGVQYTLVGHCERKAYYKEDELVFSKKISNAMKNGIIPIYIIGETKEERDLGKTMVVLERQIARVLNDFTRDQINNIIIAYEPVWSVGNNESVNSKELASVLKFIKRLIKDYYETNLPIIYGGSIDLNKIEEFKNIKELSGLLLGKSSLEFDKLQKIYEVISEN